MTRPGMLGLVRHEARALWPIWAASIATCLVAAMSADSRWVTPGRLAFFVGSVTLAAMTIGHEYTHGTLPQLLSQPVRRQRILAAKLLALTPMLASLAVIALTIGPGGPYFERGTVIGGLSVLAAVAAAPLLTMVTGSPLAGVIFGLGITGGLQLVVFGLFGLWLKLAKPVFAGNSGAMQTTFDRALAASLIVVAVATAAAGWRRFTTLEAADRRGTHLTWPRWLRSSMVLDEEQLIAPARRSRPYWLLVKKELRIQQLSLFVAAINALVWTLALTLVDPSPATTRVLATIAAIYGGLLALLIGALASAEERHMGTLEWQLLLPISAWRQFAVKTAVVLGLSVVLCFALPLALSRGELGINPDIAVAVLLLTLLGLTVSSRCASGLTAMALSAPTLFAVIWILGWSFTFADVSREMGLAVVAALAGLAWWFAFVSHRTVRS